MKPRPHNIVAEVIVHGCFSPQMIWMSVPLLACVQMARTAETKIFLLLVWPWRLMAAQD